MFWFKKKKEEQVLDYELDDVLNRNLMSDEDYDIDDFQTDRPIDLTRVNLGLLPINWDINDEPKTKEYLRDCKSLNENATLRDAIETIIKAQIEHIAMDCPDERSATLSRGSINGLCLLKERLQENSNIYDESEVEVEAPDAEKIFE